MRILRGINGREVLRDISNVLGALFFIFSPEHLIIIPIIVLIATSLICSLFQSWVDTAKLALLFSSIFFLLPSPMPVLGITSIFTTYYYGNKILTPPLTNPGRKLNPAPSSFFERLTHNPFSYIPTIDLNRLLGYKKDPFNGDLSFQDKGKH